MSIQENLSELRKNIDSSANPKVKIIAVSKYATEDQMLEAYKAGIRDFGENYVAPALEKMESLKNKFSEKVNWHLIGHLQKNKVNKAVGKFDLIQSVDSLELAQKISDRARSLEIEQDILIQINTTGEEAKSGFEPKEFEEAIASLENLSNISIKGLMTMGPSNFENKEEDIKNFGTICEVMRHLRSGVVSKNCELSIGMTQDFIHAINGGSTMIRIGRGIFGNKREINV